MLRGLYTVSTVLQQHTHALDAHANNLANNHTTGYKRDIPVYEEFSTVLLSKVGGSPAGITSGTPKVTKEVRDYETRLQTNLGYFRVQASGGTSHNTSVSFHVGQDGYLRTIYKNSNGSVIKDQGYQVLGSKGPVFVGDKPFEVNEAGDVLVEGQVVDNLVYRQGKGVIGTFSGGIKFNRNVTDFEQTELQGVDNPLAFGLVGEGFFCIETPAGERYTRAGGFAINSNMELLTSDGYKVLGLNGPIKLENYDGDNLVVNKFAELSVNGVVIDKFKIVNPENIERMQKVGTTAYKFNGEMVDKPFEGEVVQGFIEGSNVDSFKEVIQIMELYRLYESAQRVVRSYDDTLAKTVNDVARL